MGIDFPNSPTPGQVFISAPQQWLWDSQKWTALNQGTSLNYYLPLLGGTMLGPITLAADPTASLQASTKQYVDSLRTLVVTGYLPLSGGTIAGTLTLSGSLTVGGLTALNGATGVTVATADNSTNLATTAFVKGQGYATTGYVSGNYLPLTGGNISGSVTASGNLIGNNSVQSNGVYFQNNSGWFYTPQNFFAGGAVGVGGSTGIYWTVNAGQMYTPNQLLSNSNIVANGAVYVGGTSIYWQSNGGWMYTNQHLQTAGRLYAAQEVSAGNAVHVGGDNSGIYWQNNGGWMYCPVGMWCNNINTNGIQNNSQNINGVNICYVSQGAIGGYGSVQYGWANGNWVGFQATDALYAYNNQALAGGIYWTYCDERMKWNFGSVTRDCLAAINAIELQSFDFSEGAPRQRRLNPKETNPEFFRWENLPRIVKHIEAGFTAQQMREIIPEAIPDPSEEGAYLSVDLRPVVANLIGAVQQLTQRLAAVEAR